MKLKGIGNVVVLGCDKNTVKTCLFTGEKRCKKSILEQNAEIVPGTFLAGFLLQIVTCLGFAAIFLTANALFSPVRKENPASRACGKNTNISFKSKSFKLIVRKPRFWAKFCLDVPACVGWPFFSFFM